MFLLHVAVLGMSWICVDFDFDGALGLVCLRTLHTGWDLELMYSSESGVCCMSQVPDYSVVLCTLSCILRL